MSGGKHLGKGSQKPALPDDGVMRLYSMRFCPYAQRAHLVLEAKKVPFHCIYINLTEKPEWLTEYSPLGKVPALQLVTEKGKPTLIESLIISEYLDEKFPNNPLLPKDPLQKAKDKILIERFNAVTASIFRLFLRGPESAPDAYTELTQGLKVFENELNERGTPYFYGEKPGMVDYMIWPWIERLAALEYLLGKEFTIDEKIFVKLFQWRDLMLKDPAVKSFYLDGETHTKYIRGRKENNPDYDMLL